MNPRFVIFMAGTDKRFDGHGAVPSGAVPKNAYLGPMCVSSIKHHHPDSEVVHLADEDSERISGSDSVYRMRWNRNEESVIEFRTRIWAEFMDEIPTVMLDVDTLVCGSVDEIFEDEFDVCLAERGKVDVPYNAGVMFSRCNEFWTELRDCPKTTSRDDWMIIEKTLPALVRKQKYKVKIVPGRIWNCSEADIPVEARILHFKGMKKLRMVKYFEEGLWRKGR
jgi:hypothetical protein